METREQTLAKIQFYLPKLNDRELKMVAGFILSLIHI